MERRSRNTLIIIIIIIIIIIMIIIMIIIIFCVMTIAFVSLNQCAHIINVWRRKKRAFSYSLRSVKDRPSNLS